jgi:hypothetical protein
MMMSGLKDVQSQNLLQRATGIEATVMVVVE